VRHSSFTKSLPLIMMIFGIAAVVGAWIPMESTLQLDYELLRVCASNAGRETVGPLLDRGADVDAADAMGMTPLMWATFSGRVSTMRLLIERGADIGARNNDGHSALTIARTESNVTKVQLLSEARIEAMASGD
jgi:ankyrin repeat protein